MMKVVVERAGAISSTIALLAALWMATPVRAQIAGDANCDGVASREDLPLLLARLFDANATACQGSDANSDGVLSAADLAAGVGLFGPGPSGPVLTYFGIASADGVGITPAGVVDGKLVFTRRVGSGFLLVVEGHAGSSGKLPGLITYNPDLRDPSKRPDLQIQSSTPLGDGSRDICIGGVPALTAMDFSYSQTVSNALNDFGCNFALSSQGSCTQNSFGQPAFLGMNTQAQFCSPISRNLLFANGDTLLTVRLRDSSGNIGPAQQIIIRVGDAPTMTATARLSHTPTPTLSATPTRTLPPATLTATSAAASATPTRSATPTASRRSPTATAMADTPTPTRSATRTLTLGITPGSATATRTASPSATPTRTAPSPTRTATASASRPSATMTTPPGTATRSSTPTRTPSVTLTLTAARASATPTRSATLTRSATASRTPTNTIRATPTATRTLTATPTIIRTPTQTRTASRTRTITATPTVTPSGVVGPVITYFGLTRADDTIVPVSGMSPQGIPIYTRVAGAGFSLLVEGKPGPSGREVGRSSFRDSALPDLQVVASRTLGDGSLAVCDRLPPGAGGVPAVNPPQFDNVAAVNDLACRFVDGSGQPMARSRSESCVLQDDGGFDFAVMSSTVQYCGFIDAVLHFPDGDTLVTVRLIDISGNPGNPAQIIVRIAQ